jgi:hypothetical protein
LSTVTGNCLVFLSRDVLLIKLYLRIILLHDLNLTNPWKFVFFFFQTGDTSSSNNATNTSSPSATSSIGGQTTTADTTNKINGNPSSMSGPIRTNLGHSSSIYTRLPPYQNPYHGRGSRSHHRGSGHPRGEPIPKKTTGIPRDRLIPVPKHIPGALKDPTGASVVPRPMA